MNSMRVWIAVVFVDVFVNILEYEQKKHFIQIASVILTFHSLYCTIINKTKTKPKKTQPTACDCVCTRMYNVYVQNYVGVARNKSASNKSIVGNERSSIRAIKQLTEKETIIISSNFIRARFCKYTYEK